MLLVPSAKVDPGRPQMVHERLNSERRMERRINEEQMREDGKRGGPREKSELCSVLLLELSRRKRHLLPP